MSALGSPGFRRHDTFITSLLWLDTRQASCFTGFSQITLKADTTELVFLERNSLSHSVRPVRVAALSGKRMRRKCALSSTQKFRRRSLTVDVCHGGCHAQRQTSLRVWTPGLAWVFLVHAGSGRKAFFHH